MRIFQEKRAVFFQAAITYLQQSHKDKTNISCKTLIFVQIIEKCGIFDSLELCFQIYELQRHCTLVYCCLVGTYHCMWLPFKIFVESH